MGQPGGSWARAAGAGSRMSAATTVIEILESIA
jgi:hypothetical protein